MSLIVATSRIDENTLPQDSEKPSNFKNFYRSPIEIEPDSEIAVQSVKIQRTGNITIEEDDFFCHYFGGDPLDTTFNKLTAISRTIKIPRGTYSISGYEKAVKDALNIQYDDPRTFGGYNVGIQTDADGEEQGLEIICTDKGSASGKDLHASMIAVPTYNIAGPASYFKAVPAIEKSDEFTWTGGAGTFVSDLDNDNLNDGRSIGLLTGFPFGLNEGFFDITLDSCKDKPFCVGLSRPQIQVESFRNASEAQTIDERYQGILELDRYTGPHQYTDTQIRTYDGQGDINGPYEMYDYVFILDDADEITIAQRAFDEDVQISHLQELNYWDNAYPSSPGTTKLTKTQFYATWDGIRFEGFGDEIRLSFKQKGKSAYDLVVSSTYNSGAPGSAFSPTGTTSYALYPQLNIGKGTATITKMESSNVLNQYKYPTFTTTATGGYVSGDDAFSNEGFFYLPRGNQSGTKEKPWVKVNVPSAICSGDQEPMTIHTDGSEQKLFNEDVEGNYLYSLLNSAKGVDFTHLFTMNKFGEENRFDTLMLTQEYPNMSGRLGFKDRAFIISNDTDGYVTGDGTLAVTFKSTGELKKTSTSSFVRIPNLTHKSFNGAQSGLSKILYQLPQFANDGRQFGPLYFEANEKTYVKLNNTAPMILNQLQVQIVDSQERELNSLVGDTQIVFHVRKHNCD